jgi:predicted nucleotidyltransferase
MLTRQVVVEKLRNELQPLEFCRAAWLGGSDATGRADERSDVDLCVIVSDGMTEFAADSIDEAVRALSPVRIHYRLPMPTWHGFHQAFYQLADAPEELMVDWVIIEASTPHPWLEVERHGTAKVLFDKDGLIRPAHVDRAAIDAAIRKKVAEVRLKFALFRHLPAKLSARGLPVDAAHFYHALVLRPLIDLLRCVHCPDRWDFGPRYVLSDLPADVNEVLERLAYPRSVTELPALVEEASGVFERTLKMFDGRQTAD